MTYVSFKIVSGRVYVASWFSMYVSFIYCGVLACVLIGVSVSGGMFGVFGVLL